MNVRKRVYYPVLLTLLVAMLAACAPRTNIARIQQDPGRWANRDISISGTVTRSYGAMGTGIYEVDDGSGRIWVYSETRGVPSQGARVTARGRVQPTVTFGGRSYANVLRERDRRSR